MIIDKINSKSISEHQRFNGKYYLNNDALNSRRLEENRTRCLILEELAEVWNPPIFKRQFCQKNGNAIPYCQSSDVSNLFEGSDIFINKMHSIKVGAVVKMNEILVTGFGTIGNTRLINSLSEGLCYANNVCRIKAKDESIVGYLYAFLSSKYGRSQINKNASGSVVRFIEAPGIKNTLIPIVSRSLQLDIHNIIMNVSNIRVRANEILNSAQQELKEKTGLQNLNTNEFEYFGNHSQDRVISTFKRNISEISAISINAFNYSKRVEELEKRVKRNSFLPLVECLDAKGFFSSGSFKRLELNSPKSIKLINQSDIFHLNKQGKMLARLFVKEGKLVEYGEVLIAGVGTLGEGETFCRTAFASEELEGQLISGEFIRMKTNGKVPSGYLYCWLSSDYGFRFLRKTQTGTKLCRPIQELLKDIPVPILDDGFMKQIDAKVKYAHTMMFQALIAENKAIDLIEKEIDSWQKS